MVGSGFGLGAAPPAEEVLRHMVELIWPEVPESFRCSLATAPGERGWLLRMWFLPDLSQALMVGDARMRAGTVRVSDVFVDRGPDFLDHLRMSIELGIQRLLEVPREEAVERMKRWEPDEHTTRVKVRRVVECGYCGAPVEPTAKKCDSCGYFFE